VRVEDLLGRRFTMTVDRRQLDIRVSSVDGGGTALLHVYNAAPRRQRVPLDIVRAGIRAGVLRESIKP
jgi:hypothetical protein